MTDHQRSTLRPRIIPVTINSAAHLGVAGRITVTKFDRRGRQIPVRVDRSRRAFQSIWEHRQSNLITDAGLDDIGTRKGFTNLVNYVAVGTGSAAPDVSDTGLASESARSNADLGLGSDEYARPSTGVQVFTRRVAFDFAEANGNLTEFGGFYGPSGGSILTRELFRDGGGTPITITKTSDNKLALSYDIEIGFAPTTLTAAGTLTITGFGSFTVNHMFYQSAGASGGASLLIANFPDALAALTAVGSTYATSNGGFTVPGDRGQNSTSSSSPGAGQTIEAYVGSSHELEYKLALTAGAADTTWVGFGLQRYSSTNGARFAVCSWSFDTPATMLHDKDYKLDISAKLKWARA